MTKRKAYNGTLHAPPHPYLHGNFAPVHRTYPLTPCAHTGIIPEELAGGQYVRNGGNPVTNEDLGRDAHWFDGDGMLSGVAFLRTNDGEVRPHFVNQYILTDVYLSSITTPSLRKPILPSIATLVNPASRFITIILRILRALILVIFSNLPGSHQAIKRISATNTGFLFHDGRALATCESGPPMRIALPSLETIGWYNGSKAEGEASENSLAEEPFGGKGAFSWMREWTTAHPRVDPKTKELILFHSTFLAKPFIRYSIIPASHAYYVEVQPRMVNHGIPGIASPKMMHDFGVSSTSTIIMDLPLSLDPRNLLKNESVVSYDPTVPARFGVFPRWQPELIRWFQTSPCCIFHTANSWDETTFNTLTQTQVTSAVRMLACRLTSATLIYSAGDVAAPTPKPMPSPSPYEIEEEQCRLYYYRFSMESGSQNIITHQFALSAIPFEFPSLSNERMMQEARYIFGCTMSSGSFDAALGRAVKIDCLVKIDALTLIARAEQEPPKPITGCVDTRTVCEILEQKDEHDCIKIFKLPTGWCAQESRFVPRSNGASEDDGWILTYVYDESQLREDGTAPGDSCSELWVVDARDMKTVVSRVKLPQRVPYGLHGSWFSEKDVRSQRPFETTRHPPDLRRDIKVKLAKRWISAIWLGARQRILEVVG